MGGDPGRHGRCKLAVFSEEQARGVSRTLSGLRSCAGDARTRGAWRRVGVFPVSWVPWCHALVVRPRPCVLHDV
eukprot:1016913-Pleurochrysis_carterae.AAC.1